MCVSNLVDMKNWSGNSLLLYLHMSPSWWIFLFDESAKNLPLFNLFNFRVNQWVGLIQFCIFFCVVLPKNCYNMTKISYSYPVSRRTIRYLHFFLLSFFYVCVWMCFAFIYLNGKRLLFFAFFSSFRISKQLVWLTA